MASISPTGTPVMTPVGGKRVSEGGELILLKDDNDAEDVKQRQQRIQDLLMMN